VGEHEDRLRLTIAAFNENGPAMFDDPGVLALTREWIDPDVHCVAAGGVQGGSYRGIDGMIEMVREFTSAFSELTAEVEEVAETEHSLVSTVRYRGLGAVSGAPVDEAYTWAQRFRDGKMIAWVIDRDREAAIRAAGLET
jgi:hypothetical protein